MRRILIKYPIIASVIYVLVSMVIPFGAIYPLTKNLGYYFPELIKYSLTFIISLIIFIYVYKGYTLNIDNRSFIKRLFSFGAFGLICAIMAFIFSYSKIDRSTNAPEVISFILYVFMIAVSEEMLFRVLILNAILNKYKDYKNGIILSVLYASIIFGLRHYLNLVLHPNTIVGTTGQVLFTFFAGFYLSCLYIRTKNPYYGLIIHFVEDFSTMFWGLLSTEALYAQGVDSPLANVCMLVGIHSLYVVVGYLMIRKYKYENLLEALE